MSSAVFKNSKGSLTTLKRTYIRIILRDNDIKNSVVRTPNKNRFIA